MRALDERTVKIDATPFPGDPWAEALQAAGTKLGVIAIDLAEPLGGLAENRPHHLVRESVRGYSYFLHQGTSLPVGRTLRGGNLVPLVSCSGLLPEGVVYLEKVGVGDRVHKEG